MQPTNNISNHSRFINRHRWWTTIALVLLVMIVGWTSAADASYTYRKRITIDHNKVGGSASHHYDFPVLIKIQNDANLKTTANGGHVTSSSGHDIVFKDSGGSQLDHEVLSYNGSTGSLLAFVRLPQLSTMTDTIIYIHYGDSSVTSSQQNVAGVWDSNYMEVWHLSESSGDASDSTVNGYVAAVQSESGVPTHPDAITQAPDWMAQAKFKVMDVDWGDLAKKQSAWIQKWDSQIKNSNKDKK